MNRINKLTIAFIVILLLAGCATAPTTTTQTVPMGCESALVYKIPGFMPNGPMITRVSVSTALAVAATAGHPEVKLLVATVMPMLYRAVLSNNLAPAMADVQGKFKTPQFINYMTPFLVLFDTLNQPGVIQGGQIGLTDCDKNVLASLFKNIGLDSGTDPALFQ